MDDQKTPEEPQPLIEGNGKPNIGVCADCRRMQPRTYEIEAGRCDSYTNDMLPIRLCLTHIRERIKKATWPRPPRALY